MIERRSPDGSPILKHEKLAPPSTSIAHADDARISAHVERTFGASGMVWHEIVSDRVHIDVHAFPPNDRYPFHLLVTSGMSALPMNVPREMPGHAQWRHAELCVLLPSDWRMKQEDWADERWYWPIRLLKSLARFPHDFATWLGWGHSVPNGNPAKPYARGTELSGAILVPPFLLGTEFFRVPGEPPIHIFQVMPVTSREMNAKLEIGLDGLLDKLDRAGDIAYGPIAHGRGSLV